MNNSTTFPTLATFRKPIAAMLCAVPGLLLTLSPAMSATLLSDNFDSATLAGTGTNQTVTSGANTYRVLDGGDNFNGTTAGALTMANTNNRISYIGFSPITLTDIGDYITLSFTVTYPSTPANSGSALRFGLYNTFGDINTALFYNAGTNPVGDTAKGYFVTTNPGGTGAPFSSGANNITKDLGNQVVTAFGAVNGGTAGSTEGLGSYASAETFGTDPQNISLTITKTSATQVTIAASVAGENFSVVNAPVSSYFTYDTFFFSNGASAGAWQMDNLLITSSVPEPGSAALFGLATASLLIFRRRSAIR